MSTSLLRAITCSAAFAGAMFSGSLAAQELAPTQKLTPTQERAPTQNVEEEESPLRSVLIRTSTLTKPAARKSSPPHESPTSVALSAPSNSSRQSVPEAPKPEEVTAPEIIAPGFDEDAAAAPYSDEAPEPLSVPYANTVPYTKPAPAHKPAPRELTPIPAIPPQESAMAEDQHDKRVGWGRRFVKKMAAAHRAAVEAHAERAKRFHLGIGWPRLLNIEVNSPSRVSDPGPAMIYPPPGYPAPMPAPHQPDGGAWNESNQKWQKWPRFGQDRR